MAVATVKEKVHLLRSPRTVACGLTTPGKSETTTKVTKVTCGRCLKVSAKLTKRTAKA